MDIQLTQSEIFQAAVAGSMRQCEAIKNNLAYAHGANPDHAWHLHIEGALGEMAVAKGLDVYWTGKNKLRGIDVGGRFEVRTRPKGNYDLILHPADSDEAIFVLVVGRMGKYTLRGWIFGRDGKKEEYWGDKYNTGRPAYWVPQRALAPMDELAVGVDHFGY